MDSLTKSVLEAIDRVEADDPLTVRAVLKQTHAKFPLLVMNYRIKMMDAEICNGDLDAICESGIGSGPFQLVTYDPLSTTTLKRFGEYYGGTVGTENKQLIVIADQDAPLTAHRRHQRTPRSRRVRLVSDDRDDRHGNLSRKRRFRFLGHRETSQVRYLTSMWNPGR